MNVMLTGATGFVGRRIAEALTKKAEISLTCVARQPGSKLLGTELQSKSLGPDVDWSDVLAGQDVVIHAAARAHVLDDEGPDALGKYRKVNVDGTLDLAQQAAKAGVRRFIYLSSIGVNGRVSVKPFTESDDPSPSDYYARSKWEAEQGLWMIHRETRIEIVIIRPPLVYGHNAPGNFGTLVKLVKLGIPLPLGAIRNHRTFVALDNLVDLITVCLEHPEAANQVFLAGDAEDLSTTELLQRIANTMRKSSRLVPVPMGLLVFGARMLGKKATAERVLGSLQVDISKARTLLGWSPPLSVDEGLKRCFPDK